MVTDYADHAVRMMREVVGGEGRFTEVMLHPTVTIKEQGMIGTANALHK